MSPAATAQRAVRIRLLDDSILVKAVHADTLVKDIFRHVLSHVQVKETAFFGLSILENGALPDLVVIDFSSLFSFLP